MWITLIPGTALPGEAVTLWILCLALCLHDVMDVDSRYPLYLGGLIRLVTNGLFHVVVLTSMSIVLQGRADDAHHVALFLEDVVQ